MGATIEEKRRYEERFNERAAYRYRQHAGPDADGFTRWQNPFVAGSLRSEQVPASMRNPRRHPLVDLAGRPAPATTLGVSAADLPLQQRQTAGTTAHAISMGRRNAVEGVNGNLKANFTRTERGFARVFGTTKLAFLVAFTLAGSNVLLADAFRRALKSAAQQALKPRTRAKRRRGTFDAVLGRATDPARTETAVRAPP
jgi:hypothetical protein